MRRWPLLLAALVLAGFSAASGAAEPSIPALTVTAGPGGAQTWSVSIQVLLFMTALTLLPAALMMMTSFTRIVIVMAILRQALGTAQTPSNQILIGLSLFLTFFIMAPVFEKANTDGLQPYLKNEIKAEDALPRAAEPFRGFMLRQTREADLALFTRLSGRAALNENEPVPFTLLIPAFITSELNTAFQIGFLLFIPFLIIDLVVASVLMAMGMMMLSPAIISLPFKLMLFVLVDGWSLIMGSLAASFIS
jgi:flagellar biosynthetic protein FliP